MQEQGKGAADIGSGNLPVEYSPQPWKGSDFKWHPEAHLISRQRHCHLHKTIIIKQSFASAHVSKPHFTDITVQVSFVLLRADSFEKDSSVTCKSQLWLSQEKWNRRTKRKPLTNKLHYSIPLSWFYKLMILHHRPREGRNSQGSQREVLQKFSLQKPCQNNMKITFPTTEMQPPPAWDLPDF